MICDKLNTFCDAVSVALTAGSSPQNIGDVIDLGAARDIGNGEPLYLVVTVDTEVITAGSAGSIQFHLVSDGTGTIATDGSATVHASSPVYVTDDAAANSAQLNAGGVPWVVALPMEGNVYERYLAVQVTVLTTSTTAGKVNAFLTRTPQVWKAYDAPNHL